MNDEHSLKPRHSQLMAVITTAFAVGGGVWGGTTWLNNRASTEDVKKLTNDSFQHRLDLEVMKGEMKALNIRAERIEKAVEALNQHQEDRRGRRER